MSVKPILFNGKMVEVILNGRKTCTRRIVKGHIPQNAEFGQLTSDGLISCHGAMEASKPNYVEKFFKLPYQKGDILYVRESVWQKIGFYLDVDGETKPSWYNEFKYVATDEKPKDGWNYNWVKRPSIHMPKKAARLWLKVTDVRVEQLQDITEKGASTEGAIDNRGFIHSCDNEYDHVHTAREDFTEIWNNTVKKSDIDRYGWSANPWVWVIEFEVRDKPESEEQK